MSRSSLFSQTSSSAFTLKWLDNAHFSSFEVESSKDCCEEYVCISIKWLIQQLKFIVNTTFNEVVVLYNDLVTAKMKLRKYFFLFPNRIVSNWEHNCIDRLKQKGNYFANFSRIWIHRKEVHKNKFYEHDKKGRDKIGLRTEKDKTVEVQVDSTIDGFPVNLDFHYFMIEKTVDYCFLIQR